MAYVEVDYIQRVLRDDFLTYPDDLTPYLDFAQMEINAQLVGQYPLPFDDITKYTEVPALIKWIAAYLVGFKLYDERTAVEDIDGSHGKMWWDMAQRWLKGIVEGDYLLHLADGTVLVGTGSTTGPRFYPSGVRDKAPSTDNVPYFNREQAGNW